MSGLSPFVVTLGMLSFARSLAIVLSENKMIYDFGPYGAAFKIIGGGQILGLANPVWVLIVLTILFSVDPEAHHLGPAPLFDRRQRAGGAADRRAGRPRQGCRPTSCRA